MGDEKSPLYTALHRFFGVLNGCLIDCPNVGLKSYFLVILFIKKSVKNPILMKKTRYYLLNECLMTGKETKGLSFFNKN